jgi:hypothetical protein
MQQRSDVKGSFRSLTHGIALKSIAFVFKTENNFLAIPWQGCWIAISLRRTPENISLFNKDESTNRSGRIFKAPDRKKTISWTNSYD